MRYFNLLRNISNWPLYLAVKFGFARFDPLFFTTRRRPVGILAARRGEENHG